MAYFALGALALVLGLTETLVEFLGPRDIVANPIGLGRPPTPIQLVLIALILVIAGFLHLVLNKWLKQAPSELRGVGDEASTPTKVGTGSPLAGGPSKAPEQVPHSEYRLKLLEETRRRSAAAAAAMIRTLERKTEDDSNQR